MVALFSGTGHSPATSPPSAPVASVRDGGQGQGQRAGTDGEQTPPGLRSAVEKGESTRWPMARLEPCHVGSVRGQGDGVEEELGVLEAAAVQAVVLEHLRAAQEKKRSLAVA